MTSYTSDDDCWEVLVGSQTPREFWALSQADGHKCEIDAVRAYMNGLPFAVETAAREEAEVRLTRYLRDQVSRWRYELETSDTCTLRPTVVASNFVDLLVVRNGEASDVTVRLDADRVGELKEYFDYLSEYMHSLRGRS